MREDMITLPEETAAPGARGHAHALMVLGLPLIGSHLAQYAVQVTDAVMLGRYDLGDLAAQTVAGAIYFVFFIVGSGFAWAVMPMVAAAAGTDDDVQVRRVTRMGIWLSVLFGLAALPVLVFSEPLLILMGQEPLVAARGALYLKIVGIGLIPNLLIMVVKSYLAALGRTRIVFVVIAVTAALNVLLNYVLIFGNWGAPELGIAGAAIASVTLQVVGFLWLAIYAARVTPEYELFRNPWRADWEAFGRVFRLGWPIGLTNLAEVGLFAASSVMVGWIGVKELAAHGIALQIASGTFMIHIGLSQAVTVRAGRAYGRRDREGLRLGAAVGFGLSMAVVAVTVIAFLTVPGLLIAPFVSADDPARPEIMAIGAALLAVAALFQAVDAGQVMALGMLRGVQDTRVPMVIAGLSYWAVGVPASYALGFWAGLGAVGVWLGLVMGLALAGVFLTWRFWGRASSPAALGA